MSRHLYTLLSCIALPFIFIKLWRRGKNNPDYRKRWRERLGITSLPAPKNPRILIHTVSVGEFLAAKPLIEQLLTTNRWDILVTTTTPTGSQKVTTLLTQNTTQVTHCYLPYDIPVCLNHFLKSSQVSYAIVLETELWPNMIHCCTQHNIPVALINGRLSEKSAKGYGRVSRLSRCMLNNIDFAAIQYRDDAERFYHLGLKKTASTITGSIKFDIPIGKNLYDKVEHLKNNLHIPTPRKIIIAASTHEGEETIILEAFQRIQAHYPNCLLILAPRHPDRIPSLSTQLSPFKVETRQQTVSPKTSTQIYLIDTLGELTWLFGVADVAIMGGSFITNGGHNYIEPAAWKIPTITGPSRFNFAHISQQLIQAGGLFVVNNTEELSAQCLNLLTCGKDAGEAAYQVYQANRGALARVYEGLETRLP